MKNIKTFCILLAVNCALSMLATNAALAQASPSPQGTPPPATIATAADSQVSVIEREFVSAAEAMPDDKYNFAPSSLNIQGSDFKGVRTFAEQVKHVAATNYELWGAVTGDKAPVKSDGENGPNSLTTKADIVKYLKDSFALGHKAAKTLTPENAASLFPNPFGGKTPFPRLFLVTFGVAHGFDHYGQVVEYLRMNGIIPPASRGQ